VNEILSYKYTGLLTKYMLLQIYMKHELSQQMLEKYSNIKFNENPASGSHVVMYSWTDRQTDRQT